MQRAMRGMRHMLSLLWPKTAQHEVHFVGLFAPLDVLEARERQRRDRLIGLARWQYHRVHSGIAYDLELDTSIASPQACAHSIKTTFKI